MFTNHGILISISTVLPEGPTIIITPSQVHNNPWVESKKCGWMSCQPCVIKLCYSSWFENILPLCTKCSYCYWLLLYEEIMKQYIKLNKIIQVRCNYKLTSPVLSASISLSVEAKCVIWFRGRLEPCKETKNHQINIRGIFVFIGCYILPSPLGTPRGDYRM